MKRLPSSGCASKIQIVRPSQSIAETQPKLHPALQSLSEMISQYFTAFDTIWIWKFSPLMFSWNSAPSRILWRVERAYQKKRRKTGQLFSDKFGHWTCVILRESCKLPDLHFRL
jgi:hypothetical protein